jgi:hypothetical protein
VIVISSPALTASIFFVAITFTPKSYGTCRYYTITVKLRSRGVKIYSAKNVRSKP